MTASYKVRKEAIADDTTQLGTTTKTDLGLGALVGTVRISAK
jgi:hypothetical protein